MILDCNFGAIVNKYKTYHTSLLYGVFLYSLCLLSRVAMMSVLIGCQLLNLVFHFSHPMLF